MLLQNKKIGSAPNTDIALLCFEEWEGQAWNVKYDRGVWSKQVNSGQFLFRMITGLHANSVLVFKCINVLVW